MPQVRVGWRSGAVSPVVSVSKLLDSYSGAAAAYSLRKLNSSYTGSAIRVRRSSDNTELNIGFDSDGNLDTYALSSFVGTGNGFVTTWYDQSGNGREATQTTAGNQPQIVSNGVVNTFNSKPCVKFDGNGDFIQSAYGGGTTNEMYFVTQTTDNTFLFPRGDVGLGFIAEQNNWNSVLTWSYGQVKLYVNSVLTNPTYRHDVYNLLNGYKLSLHKSANLSSGFGYLRFGIYDLPSGVYDFNGNLFEWIIYPTLQSSQASIESNINSYYSIYPNPTSVWNLLAAAYNADTKSLPSLKTSLVASYNGESNANDSKGTNNGTAVGGLTYTTGKIGNAFTFNGSNAYVSLPRTTNQFDFTDFSISAWFNPSLTTSGTIFSNYHYINNSNQYGYLLYLQGSKIRFAIYQGTTSPVVGFNGVNIGQSSLNITTNTWYHIVITKTASNDFKMYINGSLQSLATISGSLNANPVYNSLNRVDIGSQWGVWSLFNGKIDALNTWTKELTASEVSELYNSGNGAQYIGDNFYKPTTNDALGTNNGTAQGGLTYGLGKVGTAFQFNGTNAYVSLPDNSLKSILTGDFSISCWFYPVDTTNTWRTIINCYSGSGNAPHQGFELSVVGGVEPMFGIYNGYSNSELRRANTFTMNQWNHVVVTRKNGVGSKLYHNGSLVTSNTNTLNPGVSTTMSSSIGAFKFGGSVAQYQANGNKIDSLNVWSKELTQADVTELYNSVNGKQYPN